MIHDNDDPRGKREMGHLGNLKFIGAVNKFDRSIKCAPKKYNDI